MPIAPIAELSLIMFVAASFRTAFGFGEALISVPLLSLIFPVSVSAPIAILASIVLASFAVAKDWRHIHFASAKKLVMATVLGIPFGLLVLRVAPPGVVKAVLGGLLLIFSMFSLYKPGFFALKDDRFIWLFGFVAGVTGGSYGMNGPPLAIYGAGRQWSPERFRATMQAYFLPASALGMLGYYGAGLWTEKVSFFFVAALPAIAVGIFFGRHMSRTRDQKRFVRLLYQGLILVSLVLILQGLG